MATVATNRKLSVYRIPPLDAKHIKSLCGDYSIKDEQEFYDNVKRAVSLYFAISHQEKQKQQEQQIGNKKALFKRGHKAADAFLKFISELSYNDYLDAGGYEQLDVIQDNLEEVKANIANTLQRLEKVKGSKKMTSIFSPLSLFIQDMHAIYKNETGAADKYTTDGNEHSGKFFELIKELIKYIDINKSDSALVSEITKALAPPK